MKTQARKNWTTATCIAAMLGIAGTAQADTVFNFDDGTLQGWTNNVPFGTAAEDYISWDTVSDNNSGRTVANSTDYIVLESDYADRDATDTTVKVLSSPAMSLSSGTSISAFALGGTGAVATPTWTNYSALPTEATAGDFMGIALRRVSDGEYLLFDQRADNGQSNTGANWAAIGWDDTEIGAAISGDSPTETYQIDLIDAFAGGWGWIGMDDVTVAEMLGDLDFDGDVDENDWPIYRNGFGQDMSGLSIAEAYLLGDLDGDFDNDPIDFGLFKTAFDNDQGVGAFAAMLVSVPEPTSIALLVFGGLLLLPANRWRRTTNLSIQHEGSSLHG